MLGIGNLLHLHFHQGEMFAEEGLAGKIIVKNESFNKSMNALEQGFFGVDVNY